MAYQMAYRERADMAKVSYRKTQRGAELVQVETATQLPFGDGLYLKVTASGAKSWVLRYSHGGKRRAMGLGSMPGVGLAAARAAALEAKALLADGTDPAAQRREGKAEKAREATTFGQVARMFYDENQATWKSDKHRDRWWRNIEADCAPIFDKPIGDLNKTDVLDCLLPIWHVKPETARRTKQQMSRLFKYATARDLYAMANPVELAAPALGKQVDKVQSHKAIDWKEAPAVYAALAEREAMSARACQFVTLSGLRSGSVRTLRWSDVHLDHDGGPMVIVAPENMKATLDRAVEFRFPLSDAAVALLASIRDVGAELVFPSPQRGKDGRDRPLTDMALLTQFKKATGDPSATVHGLRATFRTWMQDQGVSSDVAETCLQHEINSTSVEARYMRSDILELRRPVMQAWGQHLTGSNSGGDSGATGDPDVVSLDTFRRSG